MATFFYLITNFIIKMKNIYKISAILFLGLSLVVSSCKKEEAELLGCTDSTASNYNSLANTDNGSCIPFIYGCTDSTAINYDPMANTEDFTCIGLVYGCVDITAFNYDSLANTDDGSCIPYVNGCMDITAWNYNSLANTDDDSCIYAYGTALGVWDINPDCEEIDVLGQVILLDDQLPESIDVQGSVDETLFIFIGEAQVSATIDNFGNIIVVEQTASIDAGFGLPIPVQIYGSGKIESESSGYMNLTFTGEFEIPVSPIPISFSSSCNIILSKY